MAGNESREQVIRVLEDVRAGGGGAGFRSKATTTTAGTVSLVGMVVAVSIGVNEGGTTGGKESALAGGSTVVDGTPLSWSTSTPWRPGCDAVGGAGATLLREVGAVLPTLNFRVPSSSSSVELSSESKAKEAAGGGGTIRTGVITESMATKQNVRNYQQFMFLYF